MCADCVFLIDFKHGAQNKRASKEKEEKSIQKRSVSCSVKLFLAVLSFADLRRARFRTIVPAEFYAITLITRELGGITNPL